MARHRPAVAVPTGEPLPEGAVAVNVPADLALGDVTSMGRSPDDDPRFFSYAAAAGVLAAQLLEA